jgi:hypothetical protein
MTGKEEIEEVREGSHPQGTACRAATPFILDIDLLRLGETDKTDRTNRTDTGKMVGVADR